MGLSIEVVRVLGLEEVPTFTDPNKQLVAEVLGRAISDAFGVMEPGNQKARRCWQIDAQAWIGLHTITLEHCPESPFSFEWCCSQLDWNPRRVRGFVREGLIARGLDDGPS